MFNRALFFNNMSRKESRLHNVLSCQPPGDWLEGAPWERAATEHCSQFLDPVLNEGHPVVVAMGGAALRRLLNLPRKPGKRSDGISVEDFHGTANREPLDRFWVVPTFHPSHVLRGAWNLLGTVLWDIQLAMEVAEKGFQRDTVSLVEDPPLDWFIRWVDLYLEQAIAHPEEVWLSVDVETPDKEKKPAEDELSADEDRSMLITRINLSCHPDEGITVPWQPGYIEEARRALKSPAVKCLWNKRYDLKRLRAADCFPLGELLDFMDGWHVLQSDTPRGLGYVSPFYSNLGPWKHLSHDRPAFYGAMDGIQTTRDSYGIAADLHRMGMWDIFKRHLHDLDMVAFMPSEEVGLPIDKDRLDAFSLKLDRLYTDIYSRLQSIVPLDLKKLHPKEGWTRLPTADDIAKLNATRARDEKPELFGDVVERAEQRMVQVCLACNVQEIAKSHRCKDRALQPSVMLESRGVSRWYIREEFSPGSWQQVLSYILYRRHKPGRNKKSKRGRDAPSTDKRTLQRLTKTKDPFYGLLLQYREVDKVRGTYVNAALKHIALPENAGRIHPEVTNRPSMMRTSYVVFNLQNVVADKEGRQSLAAGFRDCVVAGPGCKLLSVDFSGIEAVITGWCAGDPKLIRLGGLGVHAYVASMLPEVRQPAELSWSDQDLAEHFHRIKQDFFLPYDRAKRTMYLLLYGGTPPTMHELFPESFPKLKDAEWMRDFIYDLFPAVKKFHSHVRNLAADKHFLGGTAPQPSPHPDWNGAHPYGYKHWFWNVVDYREVSQAAARRMELGREVVVWFQGKPHRAGHGKDARRVVACFPQSIAAGRGREAGLALYSPESSDWIGDAYFGKTPLRAFIHDEWFNELEERRLDDVLEKMVRVMSAEVPVLPCPEEWGVGPFIKIGVEAKVGKNWGVYNDDSAKGPLNLDGMRAIDLADLGEKVKGVASDKLIMVEEAEEIERGTAGAPPAA